MAMIAVWLLLPFLLAAGGTWLARRYALRRNLLDQPGERRSHVVPTPRGGGISIVACMLLAMAWIAFHQPDLRIAMLGFAAGLGVVAGVGWVDDHTPLSPWSRLLVQLVAALVAASVFWHMTGRALPTALAFASVMALVNVWNFMDGIDGLAASQAAIAATGLALLIGSGPFAWLAAALFGSACGFLPFNFPKARVFLGDVGSGALGYLLAILLVAAFTVGQVPWPLLLLPVSAFLIDAGFTLFVRILRRERWWSAHVQHAYQCWARRLGGHVTVTFAYAVFSVLAVILLLAGLRWQHTAALAACFSLFVLGILAWARLRRDVRFE